MPRLHLPFTRRRRSNTRLHLLMTFTIFFILLLGPLYLIYKPPQFLIHYFQRRWPDVLWQFTTSKKLIALTIDDAPSEHTAAILSVLAENNAHATFFVIGSQALSMEKSLVDIVSAGHELGNHAMHDEPSRALSNVELGRQLDTVQALIDRAYGHAGKVGPEKLFRPGSGFLSTELRRVAKEKGFRIVLGSVYPHDAQIAFARVNARHILSMVRPGGIVVCHDRRAWTVPMLKVVLPELRRRGYEIVTVSKLQELAGE